MLYFVLKSPVLHPENQSELFPVNHVINEEMLAYLGEEYGIDTIDAEVFTSYRSLVNSWGGL